jgi:Tfp pilus assembly protein PilV
MKKLVDLSQESGFGLISVLAATMIASVAILGLFMSIEYAKSQADLNYHTRSALLIAQGQLELIKYNNRNSGTYGRPVAANITTSENLDDFNGRNVLATLTLTSTIGGNPETVEQLRDTKKDMVWVEMSWREKKTADPGASTPDAHHILVQEDYYWKLSQVTPGP